MITAALLAELAVIAWRAVGAPAPGRTPTRSPGHPPLPFPSELAAAVGLFGVLALGAGIGPGAEQVAGVLGWGLVAATALNVFPTVAGASSGPAKPGAGSTTLRRPSVPPITATSPGVAQ